MKDLNSVLDQFSRYIQQKSVFGFEPLNRYYSSYNGLIFYIFNEKYLNYVLDKINVKQVSTFNELGREDSFWVDCNASVFRDENETILADLIRKNKENNSSSIILIPHSENSKLNDPNLIETRLMKPMRMASFFARILNNDLEMIVYKNRYDHKGKINLNFEQRDLLTLINYKKNKYNLVVGNTAGYKSSVFNSLIKQYLNEGKKVCYLGYSEDIFRLFLDLTGRTSNEVTPDVLNEIKKQYENRLFFAEDFTKVKKEYVVFSELDISNPSGEFSTLNQISNEEIWQTMNKSKTGEFSYQNAMDKLGSHDVSFINIRTPKSSNKLILETDGKVVGVFVKKGLISKDVYVDIKDQLGLLHLDKKIQLLNRQIDSLNHNPKESEKIIQLKEELIKTKLEIMKKDSN